MEFKEGTSVVTCDGKSAGRLHRVVIDPETREVTHVVLQSGLVSKADKVVDIHEIGVASPEEVTLLCTEDQLKILPPFKITLYSTMGGRAISSAPMLNNNPILEQPKVAEIKRTIPEKLIALKEGAPVVTKNGEHLGNIERVITDPKSGQVTHFIITKGLLQKERKLIPFDWLDVHREDKVYLTVKTQQIEDLPEFQD